MKLPAPNLSRSEIERLLDVLEVVTPYVILWGRDKIKEVEVGLNVLRAFLMRLLQSKEWVDTKEITIP